MANINLQEQMNIRKDKKILMLIYCLSPMWQLCLMSQLTPLPQQEKPQPAFNFQQRPLTKAFIFPCESINQSKCPAVGQSSAWWSAMVPLERRACSSPTQQTPSPASMCPRSLTTTRHPWSVTEFQSVWVCGTRPGRKTMTGKSEHMCQQYCSICVFEGYVLWATLKQMSSSSASAWSHLPPLKMWPPSGCLRSSTIAPTRQCY